MAHVSCKSVPLKSWAKLYTLGKGRNFSPLSLLLSPGNTKVPRSTAIFNLSSASDCPSRRLGLCKAYKQGAKCYALKSERYDKKMGRYFRPAVLPYRRRQMNFWRKISAEEFVAQFVLVNALKERPFQNIRFSESGDFFNQKDVDKAERIAQLLRRFGIRCYCYTSRDDLSYEKVKHLIVTGSNFRKHGISNIFRIVKNLKERKRGESICSGNCRTCRKCLMRNLSIIVKSH